MSAHARMTQVFLQDGYCDKPTTPRAVSTGPVHHGVGSAFLPGVRNGRTLDRHAAYAAAANVKRFKGSMPQRCSSVMTSTRATVTP